MILQEFANTDIDYCISLTEARLINLNALYIELTNNNASRDRLDTNTASRFILRCALIHLQRLKIIDKIPSNISSLQD